MQKWQLLKPAMLERLLNPRSLKQMLEKDTQSGERSMNYMTLFDGYW